MLGQLAALILSVAKIFQMVVPVKEKGFVLLRGLVRGNSKIAKSVAVDLPERENVAGVFFFSRKRLRSCSCEHAITIIAAAKVTNAILGIIVNLKT